MSGGPSAGFLGARLNGTLAVQGLMQRRNALNATPAIHAQKTLQHRLHAGADGVVQRRPIQIGNSKMYYDSVYPGFKIIKIDGDHYRGASGMDAGRDIYYSGEESEYAYDEDFEHLVLMRNYAPPTNQDHYNSSGGQLVSIGNIIPGRESSSLNAKRLSNALQGMEEGAVLPPIKINAQNEVDDGNHRLEAARVMGHQNVPVERV
jgi:hypothetical protein